VSRKGEVEGASGKEERWRKKKGGGEAEWGGGGKRRELSGREGEGEGSDVGDEGVWWGEGDTAGRRGEETGSDAWGGEGGGSKGKL